MSKHVLGGALLALALSLTTLGAEAAPAAQTVKIGNFVFGPAVEPVTVGATVTWTNDDDVPHNIVAKDGSFKSKVLDSGDSFSFTFTKPGEYEYFCSLHPHMVGKVVVKAG